MEKKFWLLASVCKELHWKNSGEKIFIELSFNMEILLS